MSIDNVEYKCLKNKSPINKWVEDRPIKVYGFDTDARLKPGQGALWYETTGDDEEHYIPLVFRDKPNSACYCPKCRLNDLCLKHDKAVKLCGSGYFTEPERPTMRRVLELSIKLWQGVARMADEAYDRCSALNLQEAKRLLLKYLCRDCFEYMRYTSTMSNCPLCAVSFKWTESRDWSNQNCRFCVEQIGVFKRPCDSPVSVYKSALYGVISPLLNDLKRALRRVKYAEDKPYSATAMRIKDTEASFAYMDWLTGRTGALPIVVFILPFSFVNPY